VQLPPSKVIHRGGRFDVLMRLGGGGMATVYLARSIAGGGFERLVALKVLHPHLLSEPEFLVMFLDEARVAAKVHHPNVIAIQDLGTQDAWMYMVMDYVLGDTLAAAQKVAMKLGRGMPLEIVLRVALDALRGLDAAHNLVDPSGRSLHVVHRDVTPHNILWGSTASPGSRTSASPRPSSG
jgi:serine/threonine-protein kinase